MSLDMSCNPLSLVSWGEAQAMFYDGRAVEYRSPLAPIAVAGSDWVMWRQDGLIRLIDEKGDVVALVDG